LLPRIARAFRELREVGLADGDLPRMYAAQAEGSAPVVRALDTRSEFPEPVKPNTVAKSIAIGNPADGFQVVKTVRDSGGCGVAIPDEHILDGVQLLAETEGIFTEPAGGATIAATRMLVEQGVIPRDESIVACITGNGYKTPDVLHGRTVEPLRMGRSLREFESLLGLTSSAATR
jgi:threonine synthase